MVTNLTQKSEVNLKISGYCIKILLFKKSLDSYLILHLKLIDMKKLLLAVIGLSLLSCGASKMVQQSKKNIKGEWLLNNIAYSESGAFNVTLLKDASKECFEGSSWQFIPNNNSGTYAINSNGCEAGTRNFIFTIEDVDASTGYQGFLLKPVNAKKKSETNEGFRLKLTQLSDMSMQWQQTVSVDGKPFNINMNFTKK